MLLEESRRLLSLAGSGGEHLRQRFLLSRVTFILFFLKSAPEILLASTKKQARRLVVSLVGLVLREGSRAACEMQSDCHVDTTAFSSCTSCCKLVLWF